ncbi:MAG: hypothetical protein JRL30_00890 [Deltaproteobacteria bacterium]|nr:hypothetical protein [Deltaproteobacteria bacterium]
MIYLAIVGYLLVGFLTGVGLLRYAPSKIDDEDWKLVAIALFFWPVMAAVILVVAIACAVTWPFQAVATLGVRLARWGRKS